MCRDEWTHERVLRFVIHVQQGQQAVTWIGCTGLVRERGRTQDDIRSLLGIVAARLEDAPDLHVKCVCGTYIFPILL